MKSLGIRQAKAHLSALVRAANNGECTLVTDNRVPVAIIGPPPDGDAPAAQPIDKTTMLSDAAAFRKALFSIPFSIEVEV